MASRNGARAQKPFPSRSQCCLEATCCTEFVRVKPASNELSKQQFAYPSSPDGLGCDNTANNCSSASQSEKDPTQQHKSAFMQFARQRRTVSLVPSEMATSPCDELQLNFSFLEQRSGLVFRAEVQRASTDCLPDTRGNTTRETGTATEKQSQSSKNCSQRADERVRVSSKQRVESELSPARNKCVEQDSSDEENTRTLKVTTEHVFANPNLQAHKNNDELAVDQQRSKTGTTSVHQAHNQSRPRRQKIAAQPRKH